MGKAVGASKEVSQELEFPIQSMVETSDGKKVIVVDYLKTEGRYVVMDVDEPGARTPARKVSPDQLRKIEAEKPEHIPSAEEIRALFERIVGGAKYEETRRLEDEKGIFVWEIKVIQEDGSLEYGYARKGSYKERGLVGCPATMTAIHVTMFDKDGYPYNGYSVAKLIDGQWEVEES